MAGSVGVKRLGLMCGTFDPPHIGHLILAQTAREQLALSRVLFLPVGEPTHKTAPTPASHRVAMIRAAIADNPHFALDLTDVERPAPHYTATLLPRLQEKFPQQELWLLLGEDSWRDLSTWYQPEQVAARAKIAVLPRPGVSAPPSPYAATWLEGPAVHVSSTMIRTKLRVGVSWRYVLPTAVRDYIRTHQLYQYRHHDVA